MFRLLTFSPDANIKVRPAVDPIEKFLIDDNMRMSLTDYFKSVIHYFIYVAPTQVKTGEMYWQVWIGC